MKAILAIFLLLFGCESLSAKKPVTNYRQMLAARAQTYGPIYDIQTTRDGVVIEQRQLQPVRKRDLRKIKSSIQTEGRILDERQVINYQSDTIYILTTFHFATSSLTIKTNKGAFQFIYSDNGVGLKPIDEFLAPMPEDLRRSESLFYERAFRWDRQPLIQLIERSGAAAGGECYMSLGRIVLQNNQVVYRDKLQFVPAVRWHL